MFRMDESVSNELRELEARRTIIKHEITIQREKLDKQKTKLLSDVQFYMEIEVKLKALYDAEEEAVDKLTQFKLMNALE